jgi:DNA modification methylase
MELENNLANIKSDIDLFGNEVARLSMMDRIGFMPTTIWKPDWEVVKKLKKIIGDTGQSRDEAIYKSPSNALRGGGKGNFGNRASIFNPHLAQMILSAYCPTAAKIYDPFAGGGTRGFIAAAMGHDYTGREIRKEEVDRIQKQQTFLGQHFKIEVGDATKAPPLENYYDFSYTCPPYYNLEVYSGLPEDLSTATDYDTFLGGIEMALHQTYRALRPGSLAVWVVGNFRDKDGDLIHFSEDVVNRAIGATAFGDSLGFKLLDEVIFLGASNAALTRVGQFASNRKAVRLHENVLIFKKPIE